MKKVIITLLIITIATVSYILTTLTKNSSLTLEERELMDENLTKLSLDMLDDKELLTEALEPDTTLEIADDIELSNSKKTLSITDISPKSLFVEIDPNELKEELPTKDGIKPTLAVKVPKNSLSGLNVGDIIELPPVGQGSYEAKIDEKIIHENGSISVTGNLIDGQEKYSVVITQGKNSTYATITTPDGAFEIESRNGVEYIYSVEEINKKYMDHTKSDVLIPPKK
jgi:hypothetical protein